MRNRGLIALGVILFLFFTYSLVQLFLLRADEGDIYPYYSSLRSDPLGTRVLYEALLECCEDLEVRRNYLPFSRIRKEVDSAVLVLGLDFRLLESLPESLVSDVDSFVREGGRLILVFLPVQEPPGESNVRVQDEESREEQLMRFVSLHELWGILPAYQDKGTGADIPAALKNRYPFSEGSEQLSAHTRLYFDRLDPEWKVIYARRNDAVIAERELGKGSVVYSALSYYLSNEALVEERHPGLLAWLIGSKQKVIFDEYHHGIYENPGIAFLIRKYEMHWFVFGVILLSLLYIWRELSPFPPFPEGTGSASLRYAEGRDAAAGLRNLLRRNIREQDLIRVCLQEWKHGHRLPARRYPDGEKKEEADLYTRIRDSLQRDAGPGGGKTSPVEEYNNVVRILTKFGR